MKILSFDIESNGLHGEAFAVAGVILDDQRQFSDEFVSRCSISGPVDSWVQENVINAIRDIPETATDCREMRRAFWAWYTKHKPDCDIIVASNPYPVEARFLIACQEDDMPNRQQEHPFPYFDLSSMLYTLGFTTHPQRHDFVAKAVGDATGDPHNPLWDAKATALGALRAIEVSQQGK